MFLLLAVPLLIFLPDPWNLVAALVSVVLFAIEVLFWDRRVRRTKVRTGVEDLIGATGEVATTLAPSGQIRVRGELWEAHSATPLKPGARVRVLAVDDLRLEVAPDEDQSAGASHATGAALLAVVALLVLAGCGGGDDESSSEAYANDVCTSMNTWVEDVQGAIGSVRESGLSTTKSQIETAVQDVASATTNLTEDLRNLGAPDTEAGSEARDELQDFGNEVERQIETVQTAIASETSVVAIAATVSTALSQTLTAAQETYQQLQGLDASEELREAFEDSDACDTLREQLDQAGSGS